MGQTQSPLITEISWGRMAVEGVGSGKVVSYYGLVAIYARTGLSLDLLGH
jgi:hypothetical protein